MTTSIRDVARERTAAGLVGRDREVAWLLAAPPADDSIVKYVHGVAGIGKSTLLAAATARAAEDGATVLSLDCRSLEPTNRGLLRALARAAGAHHASIGRLGEQIAALGARALIVLDHYEHFRLLDTWVRQALIPALPENAVVLIGSREPPVAGWLTAPGLTDVVRVLPLGPLEPADAIDLFKRLGVPAGAAETVNRVTRGHPLAIRLAATPGAGGSGLGVDEVSAHRVIEDLSRLYLADVPDPVTRRLLEAASVVRRVTTTLLSAMLPDIPAADALERLRAVPFIEVRPDGLIIHEAVQSSLASFLNATDPARYRQYRRDAWHALRDEVRDVGREELWRYTADMLYLIQNPVVREAFFPSGAQPLAVEPALAADLSSIELIAARHDGASGRDLMRAWWDRHPEAFSVVRDRDGMVAGFLCVLDHRTMLGGDVPHDPVVAGWRHHLDANPPPHGQLVLGFRRWLDLEHGEAPSSSQAASWLDVKRTYMELRPDLRRIYVVVEEPAAYLPVVTRLGFRPVGAPDGLAQVADRSYTSVVLDFGPASVDGWLAGLVAAELGLTPGAAVDEGARELDLGGQRLRLTPLEFGVLSCLQQHEGRAVSRAALLEAVWGYDSDVGSNVVDAVVRRLRRKMGNNAAAIETIRGSGYRFSIL